MRRYVAGVDSSTQSCKVVILDPDTGTTVRSGRARHVACLEADPEMWLSALRDAIHSAGGLDDVGGISVAAQQHGMCALDSRGEVIRPALLWNDVRSAGAAHQLILDLGGGSAEDGKRAWADAVGSVCFASLTVSKLRWLRDHEPNHAARTSLVCLPHDWLTWRLGGHGGSGRSGGDGRPDLISSDRSDASGTGYWSPFDESYRSDLAALALGRPVDLPGVLNPSEIAGMMATGPILAAGMSDNASAAFGVQLGPGEALVSLGTSVVISAVTRSRIVDASGIITTFNDARDACLPMVATISGTRILDAVSRLLGVGLSRLGQLALEATPGSDGLVVVPYLEGEVVPNRPDASAAVHGMTSMNSTPRNLARAAFEALCCIVASGIEALESHGLPINRVLFVGGGARSDALRSIAPQIIGRPLAFLPRDEWAARGAARQAAWALSGTAGPPSWNRHMTNMSDVGSIDNGIRQRYLDAELRTIERTN